MSEPAGPHLARPARLREAHAHIHAHGLGLDTVDLSACATQSEMLEAIRTAQPDDRGWIVATGARPEAWGDDPSWPGLGELEAAAGGIACVVWCFDYHALQLSPAGLARVRFDDDTPDPEGGRLVRDGSGALTGVALEHAALAAWQRIETGPVRPSVLRAAIDDLSRTFAEVHDLKALGMPLAAIAAEAGVRCELYPLVHDLPGFLADRERWECASVSLAGGKIFVDGTLNSRTAWMTRPYADGPPAHPAGMAMMKPAEIESAVAACAEHGLRLAAHAIGDAAVRAVLDATEAVGPPRWTVRIEHAEVIDPADVPRFARLGVIASRAICCPMSKRWAARCPTDWTVCCRCAS